ncbi:MAG TPA: ABC transporter ATP-binding protein [Casimicrobiaceae bacterium]|nr:ABC transporter ATP-binding protein [Casimicrobiaceae bacterium]
MERLTSSMPWVHRFAAQSSLRVATASPPRMVEKAREARGARLVLAGLTKHYPNHVAVRSLDLEVEAGEFLTLLGPSGSGKTTTLMMVAGFTPPTGGDILLGGRSIAMLAPEKRNIGVVFQNYALFPHMNVADNVGFPLRMRGVARATIDDKVKAAMRLVRLEGLERRMPRELSGGQQQRVALARALVFDPDLLLMDEPLGALDKNLREQMQFELKRLHGEVGVTVVYVTHDQEEALTMSDRVALMNQGVIEQLGPARELYERPVNRFVAEFIGESNVIEGTLADAGVFVARSGARFAAAADSDLRSGDAAILVARPEKFSFTAPSAGEQGLPGRVTQHVYVGDFMRYRIDVLGGLSLTVKVQNHRSAVTPREGEEVQVFLDPRDARILRNPSEGSTR